MFFKKELIEDKSRVSELDGLRGMAILAAVLYHYANNLIDANASQFHLYIKAITQYFFTSIDMFFILSGFLLGGILLRNKKSPNFFKTFYMRRICRIVPLYALILIIVSIICAFGIGKGTEWWYNDQVPFWSYLTFTQNIFIGIHNNLGNAWLIPTWSLGVEEQFYLVISFLIFFTNKKWLIIILSIGVIAAPIFRYNAHGIYALSTFPFCRLDALFGGILVAIAYDHQPFVDWFKRNLKLINRASDVLIILTILFSLGKFKMDLFIANSYYSVFYVIILLLVLIDKDNMFTRLTRNKFFVHLGLYSFSIYLFHQIVLGLVFFLIPYKLPQIHTWYDLGLVLSCAIATFIIARFSYHHFEKPFMKLGHTFKYE